MWSSPNSGSMTGPDGSRVGGQVIPSPPSVFNPPGPVGAGAGAGGVPRPVVAVAGGGMSDPGAVAPGATAGTSNAHSRIRAVRMAPRGTEMPLPGRSGRGGQLYRFGGPAPERIGRGCGRML